MLDQGGCLATTECERKAGEDEARMGFVLVQAHDSKRPYDVSL